MTHNVYIRSTSLAIFQKAWQMLLRTCSLIFEREREPTSISHVGLGEFRGTFVYYAYSSVYPTFNHDLVDFIQIYYNLHSNRFCTYNCTNSTNFTCLKSIEN